MQVGTEVIETKTSVKYLDVMLDMMLTFWDQIKVGADKGSTITVELKRIMDNIVGLRTSKYPFLMAAAQSFCMVLKSGLTRFCI